MAVLFVLELHGAGFPWLLSFLVCVCGGVFDVSGFDVVGGGRQHTAATKCHAVL
jgi:hypothetical protein